MEFWNTAGGLLLAFVGGTGAKALIDALHDRWKFRATRNAQKEDKADEKADKTEELESSVSEIRQAEEDLSKRHDKDMKDLNEQMSAQSEALRLLLLDRILSMGEELIEKREITFDERKRFHDMHKCYHNRLGGNGDADIVVGGVDRLPLKTQA